MIKIIYIYIYILNKKITRIETRGKPQVVAAKGNSHSDSILLTVSVGLQYEKLFVSQQKLISQYLHHQEFFQFVLSYIKAWDVEYCCLKLDSMLEIILYVDKGMQSFLHNFFKYFLNIWQQRDWAKITMI